MTFDNIKLEKGLYSTEKSFTQALESIDPSENYVGTELDGLDAYQRQLKRFDIKVSGRNSDSIEKFFRTSDSAALFPEYVSRAVNQGIQEADVVSKLIATTTTVNSLDYRSLICDSFEEFYPIVVNEGTHIPETKISVQENLVKLRKRGRILSASYEAIKFQRLDLFTVTLKQIGASIAYAQLNDAIDVILNGDGNNNPAYTANTDDSGEISYSDLLNLWTSIAPYKLTTILTSPYTTAKILKLGEFRDAYTGLDFHSTGKLVSPFGAELCSSIFVPENTIIGLDKNFALEKVQAGSIITEYDKLIDRQLERATISSITGFAKISPIASAALSLD